MFMGAEEPLAMSHQLLEEQRLTWCPSFAVAVLRVGLSQGSGLR